MTIVTYEIEISDTAIWNELVTAFESGSGYWARSEVADKAGLTRIDYGSEILAEENKKRAEKAELAGEYYSSYSGASEDLVWLKENGHYIYSSQIPLMGGEITIYDSESWNGEGYDTVLGVVNRETIDRGLQLMADKAKRHFNDMISEGGDSTTSDVLLQYITMSEVIYG